MQDYVIIANGPFPTRAIIEEATHGRCIVALDGAVNQLLSLNINPHVILGDFDSINQSAQDYWGIIHTFNALTEETAPYLGLHGVFIVPAKNQDHTDLVKGIQYCDKQNARSISIISATGGREDLHESTKIALQTEYRANRPIIVHTEYQSLCYAYNESIELLGKAGDYCGIIALNTGRCTSEGLEYECQQHELSISNRLKTSQATLHIQGGALIIMPPQLAAQRKNTDECADCV